uniref:MAP3K7_0 protein n=1 Tax=Fopius arisanus TaxID=64838 RepID=A0A0C9QQD3_9HYME
MSHYNTRTVIQRREASVSRFSSGDTEYLEKFWFLLKSSTSADDLDDVYRVLDADLRPLTPDNSCPISKEIFEEHKLLAQEYLKIQTEIALVGQYRSDMLKSLSPDALKDQQELSKLEDEKESLVKLYRNLKRQLELMKGQGVTSTPSVNSAVPGNNGWVFIPRQEPSRIS